MGLIVEIKALRHKVWQGLWRKMPIQQNKVILWSDNFKSFGCSPKYIALHLAQQYPGKFDIVWVLEHGRPVPEGLPDGIRIGIGYIEKCTLSGVLCAALRGNCWVMIVWKN